MSRIDCSYATFFTVWIYCRHFGSDNTFLWSVCCKVRRSVVGRRVSDGPDSPCVSVCTLRHCGPLRHVQDKLRLQDLLKT